MKKNLLLTVLLFVLYLTPPFGGTRGAAQNIGISTDATPPETGLMLDIKVPNNYDKGTDNSAQPFFQIKSYDSDASAIKLRIGLRTHSAQANRYAFMEFLEAGTPTYLPLALQPSEGNVGIGTTSPAYKLHISASSNPQLRIENVGGANALTVGQIGDYGGMGLNRDNITGTAFNSNKARASIFMYAVNNESQIRFATNNTNASDAIERMRINKDGNVGIGTTTPQRKLHIIGVDGVVSSFPTTLGIKDILILENNNNSNIALIGSATGQTSLKFYKSGGTIQQGTILYDNTSDYLSFAVNGGVNEKMRIDNAGNVGIGTINPSQKLDVAGIIRIYDSGPNTGLLIGNTGTGGRDWQLLSSNNSGVSSGGFNIWDNTAALTRFSISATGNVGIGTVTPTDRFQVYNGSTTGTYTSTGWAHTSDARLKTNLIHIDNALDKVRNLNGMYYHWKNAPDSARQIGFIAQEVEKIIPEVVVKDAEGNYSMVYQNLTSLLVEAIKEMEKKYNEEIKNLKEENKLLKLQYDARIHNLEKLLDGKADK